MARHFPTRNRIVSGLSLAVVVIEAAHRSGTLITARLAAEQGREVMAVPGHPLDARAGGCNALIRDGATLVRNAEDVIAALGESGAVTRAARHLGAPEMGVRGAAIVAVVVQFLQLGAIAGYAAWLPAARRHHLFQRFWRPDWAEMRQVFALGLPIGLTMVAACAHLARQSSVARKSCRFNKVPASNKRAAP